MVQLAVVVLLATGAGVAGLPMPVAVLIAAGAGGAVIVRHLATSRAEGVEERLPGALSTFEVALPAERVAVGRLLQVRLFSPTRQVWAPGMLGATRGALSFLPARSGHADRAWSGPVEAVEVHAFRGPASVVRAHGPAGSAQFVVQASADQTRQALAPFLRLVDG